MTNCQRSGVCAACAHYFLFLLLAAFVFGQSSAIQTRSKHKAANICQVQATQNLSSTKKNFLYFIVFVI